MPTGDITINFFLEKCKMKKVLGLICLLASQTMLVAGNAFAEGAVSNPNGGLIAVGAGLAISFAAAGGALGQGKAVGSALEAIGRNPGAADKLMTPMVLGLVFMETLVIFSFVIAFFLQGKV